MKHMFQHFFLFRPSPFLYKNMFYLSSWTGSYIHGTLWAKFQPDVLNSCVLVCGCLLYVMPAISSKRKFITAVVAHLFQTTQNLVISPLVPRFYSYLILASSVIYKWTDARQYGIFLLNWQSPYPNISEKDGKAGADPGEVKWVNFHPPFSEPPSFLFFFLSLKYWPQTPQPGFGSITLLHKFTPPPPPFQNPGSAPAK